MVARLILGIRVDTLRRLHENCLGCPSNGAPAIVVPRKWWSFWDAPGWPVSLDTRCSFHCLLLALAVEARIYLGSAVDASACVAGHSNRLRKCSPWTCDSHTALLLVHPSSRGIVCWFTLATSSPCRLYIYLCTMYRFYPCSCRLQCPFMNPSLNHREPSGY